MKMRKATTMVPIDVPALYKWLDAQPQTNAEIAASLGKGATFF